MPIITISRGSASGGLLLAQGLAERLGYELVSREDIIQRATRFGVAEAELQQALLKPVRFWERFRHERRRYLAFVQDALCERAQGDRIIYHGNAGHLLLHGVSHVFCIRLIAPASYRVELVMERLQLGREEAIRHIEAEDRQRRQWTRFLYGVDWLDPTFYDLTINLHTLQLESAIELAAITAARPEFQPTEESRQAMADLRLASRVRAALAANRDTAPADVRVRADGDVVYLSGRVRPLSMLGSILDVAAAVPGVARVDQHHLGSPDLTV